MFLSLTRRAVMACGYRIFTPSRLRAVCCLGVVFTFTTTESAAEPPSVSSSRQESRATSIESPRNAAAMKRRLVQSALKAKHEVSKQKGTAQSPAANAQKVPIRHGVDVGPSTVGLRGAGVRVQRLELVTGGKASNLANGIDPATGRPMLSLLDIAGQLTIDVPCVLDRCRVTQVGGLYAIRNSPMVDFEARDCEFEAAMGADGTVADCVVLNARTLRRCIVKGGRDGIKLASIGGCLIEDCWIYAQIAGDGAHCDGIQMMKGEGDWDTWIINRCRIEGPWQRQTCALMLQADTGNLSGVTVRDCLLSGGTYTVYTRAKTGNIISKVRIVGNVWVDQSWKYGPHSNDCEELDFSNNWIAPAVSETSPIAVSIESARQIIR